MRFRKLLHFLTGRMFLTSVLLLAQAVWFALLANRAVEYAAWARTLLYTLSLLIALYIINKDDVPAYRLGWILIIMVTPVFGGLLFLLLGEKRPAASLRVKLKQGNRIRESLLFQDEDIFRRLKTEAPRGVGTFKYVSDAVDFPVWQGTQVKFHKQGEEQYEDMLTALAGARRFIFLEYFIIQAGEMWDTVLEILTEKVRQGLDVRLIYDDMGCVSRLPSGYNRTLEKLGIKCLKFNRLIPFFSAVVNHRDHRKILVVDGHTAFTGGVNLADEYINRKVLFGHWKDSGVMLRGQAVWSFTVMFLEMWNSFRRADEDFERFRPRAEELADIRTDGYVQPFSDSPLDGETVSVNVYLDLLAQAKDYVYIFTPYLAIDDEMQLALCQASRRGVDVRMALPGIPDKKIAYRLTRSYYRPLRRAGVKLYEYTPGFLHAKSYVCDDEIAVVGTINMDYRSLYLHFECGVLLYGCSAIADIKADALKTFALSHKVRPRDRDKGLALNFAGALFDSILRVFAPLF